MRRHRSRAALPLVAGAVLTVTLGGCSGAADTPPASAHVAAVESDSPAPTVTPLAEATPGADAVALYAGLNAADSEFPDAVVEAGQGACERASYLVQVSEDEFRAALDGPLALADTAVPLLCPSLLDELARARGGIGDGETPVGAGGDGTVAPGEYRTVTAGTACSWRVSDRSGGVSAQGRVEAAGEPATLVVGALDGAVSSEGCGLWLPAAG